MSPGYYIYYRIALERADEAKRIVAAIQDEVLMKAGVRGRLLRRRDDPATWMEVYEDVAEEKAFVASLAAAVERHGFQRLLVPGSSRIAETFVPL